MSFPSRPLECGRMQILCHHCGQSLTIGPEQFGTKASCPHCQGAIVLPRAAPAADETTSEPRGLFHWLENSISALVSVVAHMALFLILAMVSYGGKGVLGEGEEVFIGVLPSESLSEMADESLSADDVAPQAASPNSAPDEMLEVETPVATAASNDIATDVAIGVPSPSGAAEGGTLELGATGGGGSMAGGSWEGLIQTLRRNGLDIVITFDSTGSMSGEINEVKRQIERISTTLVKLVPQARISICTYRDDGDEYVVKGLPLTGDMQAVSKYLAQISAGGGGDTPEAVHEGLYWASRSNQFKPRARKVILLFGDAPPHAERLRDCLQTAAAFSGQQQGVVSTVTCRNPRPLPEFYEIARAGGGEAFLTSDERQIMTQLLILVFGSQHRAKVVEAFKLLDK